MSFQCDGSMLVLSRFKKLNRLDIADLSFTCGIYSISSSGVICGFKPLSDFLDAIVPPVASNKIRFFCCILSLRSIVIIPSVQQEAPPRFPLWLPSRYRCGQRYAYRPHAPDIQMQNRLFNFSSTASGRITNCWFDGEST